MSDLPVLQFDPPPAPPPSRPAPGDLPVLQFDPPAAAVAPASPALDSLPVLQFDPPAAAVPPAEPTAPPALTPLSSLYSGTTGAPGAESLANLVAPPAPAAGPEPQFTDPMSGMPIAPLVNGPPAAIPDTGEGFFSGMGAGFRNTTRDYARTFSGQAFTPDPDAIPQPKDRTWLNQLGYGLGGSPVVLGGGIAGGIAGAAAGAPAGPGTAILGSIIGSGVGMGLPTVIQELAPSYQAARQQNMSHDQAVDYAINKAVTTGSITAATAPLFVLTPVKGLIGRLLYQSFIGMPAAGAATRIGVPGVMGEPLPSGQDLATGYSHDVVTGLGFGLGHHLGTRAIEAVNPLEPPPQPAWSIADRAAVEALTPTGQVYRTERPSDLYPAPQPPGLSFPQPGVEMAPGTTPGVTAELAPAPLRSDATLTGPEAFPPAQPGPAAAAPAPPAAAAPAIREGPLPYEPAAATPPPGPAEEPLPARSSAPEAPPAEPAAVVEPSPRPPEPVPDSVLSAIGDLRPTNENAIALNNFSPVEQRALEANGLVKEYTTDSGETYRGVDNETLWDLRTKRAAELAQTRTTEPEPVTGAPIDRPGAAAGRPGRPPPVGEEGAPRVEPGPGEIPGGPRLGTDLGERPPDTQGTSPGAVAAEPPPRPTETPAAEQAAPIREAPLTGRLEALPGEPGPAPRLTTEPDDVVPGQHVAKNEAGEVVGKGATPEAATADAQQRGGEVYPPEALPGEAPVARAPSDYLKLDPNIPAADYTRRMSELRDNKPRPINKLWNNPETAPPEQVEAARQALRDWNREYRLVSRNQKLALERDNTAYRAGPPREALPGFDVLERNRTILDEQRAAAEARFTELSPAEQRGIRLNEEQQETGRITPADPTLEKLQATRDALTSKTRTPAEERKLDAVNQQITQREAFLDRRGGVKQPFSGPPKVGREPDFLDYKFNNGTSVFRSVFAEAGHNPDTATSLPIEKQIPILTSHMEKKFGFSSVEVVGARGEPASRVDQKIQRDAMLDMTRAMHDLMASLGLPLEAASNHGTLRLVLAPAEPGAYGAYVSDGTINVKGGANSFGHEWIHAIDHILAERFTGNPRDMNKLLTQYGRDSGLDVTDNVQAAMAKLINTMFYEDAALAARHLALSVDAAKVDKAGNPTKKALAAQDQLERLEAGGSRLRIHSSEFRTEAAKLDAGRSKPYFPTVYEMLARGGEAYMSDKMRTNGVDPRGVVMPDEAYTNMVDHQLRMAYPKQDERTAIFKAYDDLFTAMKNEQILDQGKPAATVADYGVSDPHHWSVTAPGLAGTGPAKTHQQTVNSYRNFTSRLLNELKLTDPNRPPPLPGQTVADKMKDFGRAYLYSYGSMMKVIIDRAPPEAQKILRPILDSLATAPGSGRYTPENFEEIVRDTAREWTRRYGNMLESAGFDPQNMTAEQGAQLRHGLVTGDSRMPDGTLIPANIQELTGNVRELLDEVWSRARDAGLDIGYAKNGFFPRIYDRYRAAADPAGFRRAAHELYSFMFDSEVGAPGTDPQALLEKWTTMPAESRAIQTDALTADPDLPTKMAELRQNLQAQQDPNITPAELARLQGEAQQLAIDAHDTLRDHIAEMNAASWHANLTGGGLADFDTGSPTGKFLQARVLPPEADRIMAAYLHTDPSVAIPGYLHSVARRTAHADLFGANGERLTAAENSLNRIDGMAGDDVTKFMELVADVTGRNQPGGWNRFRQQSHNVIQGAGALVMMERAVWSALTEPMVASMVTGNAGAGFRNMGYVLGQLIRTADARDRTALAEFLNVIASPQHDSVMLSRMGADVNDQPRLGRFLSNFYRATFLTQVTNGQRAGTVGTSNWFIGKLAQHFLDTGTDTKAGHRREDARRWFRELGLPDDIHQDFAQFMVDQQGALPSPQLLLNHRFGDAYSLATRRLVDRIIQDPYKVDRAMMSGQPLTGLAFQLMSFNYSFQKNVLNPAAERVHHQFSRGRAEAMAGPSGVGQVRGALRGLAATPGVLGATVAAGASMFTASLFTTIVRQLLYAPDQWNKHQEDGDLWPYLKDLAFSRSGLNGVVDPILQAFSHLKYDSDLTAMIHGAAINTYMQNLQQVLQPILGTTDSKTNTALYNQARALYNLVGVPLTASILTAASTVSGPIGKIVSGAALQWLTSPGAANWVARQLAGPKGATRPETGGPGGGLSELSGLSGLEGLPGIDSGGAASGKAAAGGGHAVAAGPIMGLVDDVAVPAMRYLGPMISSLSPATKAAAGIAAGAYGAYEYLKSTAPFRGQPAPEPKRAATH
jgi:hypothetical protein